MANTGQPWTLPPTAPHDAAAGRSPPSRPRASIVTLATGAYFTSHSVFGRRRELGASKAASTSGIHAPLAYRDRAGQYRPVLQLLSALYWAYVFATMPFLFLGAVIVFLVTVAFDRRRVLLHLYSCAWATVYLASNPLWRARIRGRSYLPWRGPAVIVSNHLSILDILVLYGLFRPFKWVSKASLFKIPFLGWNMRMNDYVAVERGERDSIKQMMTECRRHLARGTPLLLFPEGTRAVDGRLQRFRDGAFKLAFEAKVPLIPIAVSGTSQALPKHGLVMRERMHAAVQVLQPLDPRSFENFHRLRDAALAAIAAALPKEHRPLSKQEGGTSAA